MFPREVTQADRVQPWLPARRGCKFVAHEDCIKREFRSGISFALPTVLIRQRVVGTSAPCALPRMMCGENLVSPALEAVLSAASFQLHDPGTRQIASAMVKMSLAVLDQKLKEVGLPFCGMRSARQRASVSWCVQEKTMVTIVPRTHRCLGRAPLRGAVTGGRLALWRGAM